MDDPTSDTHPPSLHQLAALCPQAAAYSLHLPLQKSQDRVMRLLRVVESECEVLQSKERCPYLAVFEVLQQPYSTRSEMLYSDGHQISTGTTSSVVPVGKSTHYHSSSANEPSPYSPSTSSPWRQNDDYTSQTSVDPHDRMYDIRPNGNTNPDDRYVDLFARHDHSTNSLHTLLVDPERESVTQLPSIEIDTVSNDGSESSTINLVLDRISNGFADSKHIEDGTVTKHESAGGLSMDGWLGARAGGGGEGRPDPLIDSSNGLPAYVEVSSPQNPPSYSQHGHFPDQQQSNPTYPAPTQVQQQPYQSQPYYQVLYASYSTIQLVICIYFRIKIVTPCCNSSNMLMPHNSRYQQCIMVTNTTIKDLPLL